MIVSVHLPKTAGTSFKKSLNEHFTDKIYLDYDKPFQKTVYERNKNALVDALEIKEIDIKSFKCIHGHFLPIKYLLVATQVDITFITWMRNPVDRLISHYYYWKKRFKPGISGLPGLDEETSLEEFCLHPRFKNLYSQYFFGFPLERFDFIGITEFYDEDFLFFSKKYLGSSSEMSPYQCNTRKQEKRVSKESIASEILEKIEAYHAEDIALYKRALNMRNKRK